MNLVFSMRKYERVYFFFLSHVYHINGLIFVDLSVAIITLIARSTREIMSRKCNSWVLPNNLEVLKGVMARPRPQDTVQHTTQHTSGKP